VQENADFIEKCLEERKQQQQIAAIVEKLRKELRSQQEAVAKNDARVKKRESELKEKTQELRKLRADVANAKLQLSKVTAERDDLKKGADGLPAAEEEKEAAKKELLALKQKFFKVVEDVETKDSELEGKVREVEVLRETVEQLKNLASKSAATSGNEGEEGEKEGGGDWDDFDDPVAGAPDMDAIQETAQLKVDLRKAQEACEKLTVQLTEAETSKDHMEVKVKEFSEEIEVARKVKEQSLKDKADLEKKLDVLTTYFNQRESDLQKQLGMTANRLTDTTSSGETAAKTIQTLQQENEVAEEKIKSLEKELVEQERSLKAQNLSLEKKQHESWVSQRQEARRSAEAQSEMATLRSRLTVVESKLVEKELEIGNVNEENEALKSTVEKLSRASLGKQEAGKALSNSDSVSTIAVCALLSVCDQFKQEQLVEGGQLRPGGRVFLPSKERKVLLGQARIARQVH